MINLQIHHLPTPTKKENDEKKSIPSKESLLSKFQNQRGANQTICFVTKEFIRAVHIYT
jgi:hypothetical protein